MFKEMRRIKNKMSHEDAIYALKNAEHGTLGTISYNGYPYTVVVNHIFYKEKIYFHSANEGHKIDNIIANDKVSFSVVLESEVIRETFTTKYKSVTVFGRAKVIPGSKDILYEFIKKFSKGFLDEGKQYINKSLDIPIIIEIDIDHITGKERI